MAELAADLKAQPRFACWIGEYFTPRVYPYLRGTARSRVMVNAPFQFFPADWLGFFESQGWVKDQLRFSAEVGMRFGRRPPMPWWAGLMMKFMNPQRMQEAGRASGFLLMVPKRA